MKKFGCIIFILISSMFFAFAQNEGNVWYFGQNAGLDFNTGSPVVLTDGQLVTQEGCASIADNNGDLLFYTDGQTVYDASHNIMLNGTGLLGHSSSTQSAIIVKKPASSTIYYIFTADGYSGGGWMGANQGLHYSEVDMTLNSGLGDVTLNKNIMLIPQTCEKLTAIKHQNNTDYWVISRVENSNTYHSYLLTSSGVNTTPVVTNIGAVLNETGGYLKASADGSRIVAGFIWNNYDVELYDFDNSTGILSNLVSLNTAHEEYGVEFSPNGNILYTSSEIFVSVYQLDLLAGSEADIVNSEILLGTGAGMALQLAPDGKIYVASWGSTNLSVINNPDILGAGCNFNSQTLDLTAGGVHLGSSIGGLPTFYSSIFVQTNNFSFNNPCYGDSSIFNISNTSFDSVLWNFGDPNSGTNNISTNINPFHNFSDTGTFQITLYSYLNGMIDTVVNDLFVSAIPVINLGNDTVICEGETLSLDAALQNATYLWQDNYTNSTYTVSTEGEYFVEITVDGCSNTDTINVIYSSLPQAIISGDYEVCYGDQIDIDVIVNGSPPFEITYTNGTDTNVVYGNNLIIIEAIQSGTYEITNVLDQFDCIGNYSGSAEIIINPCSLSIHIPNAFTPNSDYHNEGFMPSIDDINDVVNYNIIIFNRWGDIVYETNEIGKYWDGRFNNTDAQQGVYVYIVTVTDIYDNSYNFNGYVCLIR